MPALVAAESEGVLSTATAAVALAAAGDPAADVARTAVAAAVDDLTAWPTTDVYALAWATLALDVDRIREVFVS